MKQLLLYTKLEYKRFFKLIPHFIIGAAALFLTAQLIAFCADRMLSEKSMQAYQVKVALAFHDSSNLTPMFLELLKNSDCVSDSCEFVITDAETAKDMVKKGEVSAAIIIPDGILDSIQNGTNLPVDISFAEDSNIIALILRQLSEAGAGTLSAAQAGIYAQYDLYKSYGLSAHDKEANEFLNTIYLKYVLEREHMFYKTPALPTGTITIPKYYKCSGTGLILLLLGISCSGFLWDGDTVFSKIATAKGIPYAFRFLVKIAVFTTFTLFLLALILPSFEMLFPLLPAVICCHCTALFFYRLCGSPSVGILTIFIWNFVSCFISGYVVPPAFFPDYVKQIADILPAGLVLKQIQYAFTGGASCAFSLWGYSILIAIAAFMVDFFKTKGGN